MTRVNAAAKNHICTTLPHFAEADMWGRVTVK